MKKSFYIFSVFCICFSFCKSKKNSSTQNSTAQNNAEDVFITPAPLDVVEGLNLGNMAPEITLKNPKDSAIFLSSLRGKIVLVDFWASWCGPCRFENPTVVAANTKYQNAKLKNAKGFAVYSVSLDTNKDRWESAIKSDNLYWPYHVSDLQGWANAAAQKYGVTGIPTNYLLDANGVIIAKGLRGPDLEKALEKLLIN